MGYVSGDNLAKRLHERGVLTTEETRKILRDVGDALAYAHEAASSTATSSRTTSARRGDRPAVVTDFGIARAMDGSGDSRLTPPVWRRHSRLHCRRSKRGRREIDGRSDCYPWAFSATRADGRAAVQRRSTPAMLVKTSRSPDSDAAAAERHPTELARHGDDAAREDPAHRFPNAAARRALDAKEAPPSRAPTPPPLSALSDSRPAIRAREPAVIRASCVSIERSRRDGHAPGQQVSHPTPDELRRWEAPPCGVPPEDRAYLFVTRDRGVRDLRLQRSARHGVLEHLHRSSTRKLWTKGYDWRTSSRAARPRIMESSRRSPRHCRASSILGTARCARIASSAKLAARMSPPVGDGIRRLAPRRDGSRTGGDHGWRAADRVRQASSDRDESSGAWTRGGALPAARQEYSRRRWLLADKVQSSPWARRIVAMNAPGSREKLENEISTLENAGIRWAK